MIYAVGMSMLAIGGVMMGYHAFKLAELFEQAAGTADQAQTCCLEQV